MLSLGKAGGLNFPSLEQFLKYNLCKRAWKWVCDPSPISYYNLRYLVYKEENELTWSTNYILHPNTPSSWMRLLTLDYSQIVIGLKLLRSLVLTAISYRTSIQINKSILFRNFSCPIIIRK